MACSKLCVWDLQRLQCGQSGTLGIVVSWKCFNMEKVVIKKGEKNKKIKLMHMEANSKEFILALKSKLQYFVGQKFITRWQD